MPSVTNIINKRALPSPQLVAGYACLHTPQALAGHTNNKLHSQQQTILISSKEIQENELELRSHSENMKLIVYQDEMEFKNRIYPFEGMM